MKDFFIKIVADNFKLLPLSLGFLLLFQDIFYFILFFLLSLNVFIIIFNSFILRLSFIKNHQLNGSLCCAFFSFFFLYFGCYPFLSMVTLMSLKYSLHVCGLFIVRSWKKRTFLYSYLLIVMKFLIIHYDYMVVSLTLSFCFIYFFILFIIFLFLISNNFFLGINSCKQKWHIGGLHSEHKFFLCV